MRDDCPRSCNAATLYMGMTNAGMNRHDDCTDWAARGECESRMEFSVWDDG